MEMRRVLGWLAAVVLMAAVAPAVAQQNIKLSGDDNYSTQSLTVGDSMTITLPSARADGYEWRLKPMDSNVLALDAPGKARQIRTQSFHFTAANAGVVKVTLNNVKRADTAMANPVQVYEVMVGVSSKAGEAKPGAVIGKFERFMPCADCEGVHETITLYAKGANELVDTIYERTLEYVGKPKDTTFTDKGIWALVPGMKGDAGANVYQLTNGKGEVDRFWLKAVNELVPLDNLGVPMEGPAGKPFIGTDTPPAPPAPAAPAAEPPAQ